MAPVPPPCGYDSPNEEAFGSGSGSGSSGSSSRFPFSTQASRREVDPEQGVRSPETASSNSSSLNGMVSKARNITRSRVSIGDRIACFQWTWFTMTMATGGIANVLHSLPYKVTWIDHIGLAFFFFNMCLFAMNTILISMRFYLRPGSFTNSFTDQMESLFISSCIVSAATIFITVCQYGIPRAGPWLVNTMEVLFWIYISVSVLISAFLYLTLWSTQVFPIHTMTPIWVFPAYPLLIAAPLGSNLVSAATKSGQLSHLHPVPITLAAVAVQGTGFLISFMICAAFLYRLMTQKLPRDHQRPGIFISIGPAGFTAAGLVTLGNQTQHIFPADFMGTDHAVVILKLLAYMVGLWLWGLSIWFFLVSIGSLWKYVLPEHRSKMPFQMTWFSFVFPNTALVTATEALAVGFESKGLQTLGAVLAVCIILVWFFVFFMMLRCLYRRQLLWPKDES